METLAPVALDLAAMRRVVAREGGCIVWGGSVLLSPAGDVLIRLSRPLDLDGEGARVASLLVPSADAGRGAGGGAPPPGGRRRAPDAPRTVAVAGRSRPGAIRARAERAGSRRGRS